MYKGTSIFDEITFNGFDGMGTMEFIQTIRRKAYTERGSEAEMAALCLAGNALEWYEGLDADVQVDWALLRKALIARFPPSPPVESRPALFTGEGSITCADFIQMVQQQGQNELDGMMVDDQWLAHYAGRFLGGKALKWHIGLDAATRNSWKTLAPALAAQFPDPPSYTAGLNISAGRIPFRRLDEVIPTPSFLPRSEEEWLRQAKDRKELYEKEGESLPGVYWLLCHRSEEIPLHAIRTGTDTCTRPLYTARAWFNGGLHPGKCGRHLPAAHIPFGHEEYNHVNTFEVLVGDPKCINWIGVSFIPPTYWNDSPVQMKAVEAVEGGMEANGTPLLLAQAHEEGRAWQPGKVNLTEEWCQYGWDLKTFAPKDCRILVWA